MLVWQPNIFQFDSLNCFGHVRNLIFKVIKGEVASFGVSYDINLFIDFLAISSIAIITVARPFFWFWWSINIFVFLPIVFENENESLFDFIIF